MKKNLEAAVHRASKEAKADAEDHLQQVDRQHLVHLEPQSKKNYCPKYQWIGLRENLNRKP